MWNPAEKWLMTEEQSKTLKAWVAAKTSPQRTVLRARICLLAAEGLPNRAMAKTLKTSRPRVVQWRKGFEERGPQGLAEEAPHGLSSRALAAEKVKAIVEATLHTTPSDATHTGLRGRWPKPWASPMPPSLGSGMRTGCNRTASRSLSFRKTNGWSKS